MVAKKKANSKRAEQFANDAERSKADILAVATEEFALNGLSGARVDAIADRTRTSKRMIYYYFGSKEGLFIEVIEGIYRQMNEAEARLPDA
ncbi:MAG: TetR/AcrR family transcriptional regulator, partial [Gammaproteobacteria bacterium]|nr:TetR/AcrR family transcriptional regulator [Gammaproteobacteria bacterium]